MEEVKLSEARACYSIQTFMENVHSHTYSLLIDTIVREKDEKDKLFNAVENFPAIKEKNDWAMKWIGDRKRSYGSRLVAFACVCHQAPLARSPEGRNRLTPVSGNPPGPAK